MIATAIAVLILVSSLVQLGYWLCFFRRAGSTSVLEKAGIVETDNDPYVTPRRALLPVSIIICAKNEARNLTEYLPFVLEQNYKDEMGQDRFEVIVVNDQSTDNSDEILENFCEQHSHLRVINIPVDEPRTLPGKKFALSRALAAASYDHILMTDADCRPASTEWILWMAQPFLQDKEIVAGYGGYYKRKGLLNNFVRWETIHTFQQYFTYNLAGVPYMAVGRNLACRKELLLKAQNDPLWGQTVSGDDDLLIRLCATADNMEVNMQHESFTYSEAKSTWNGWVKQKQRHFSTGKLYSRKVQLLLGGYALSHACFWISTIAGLQYVFDGGIYTYAYFAALCRCSILWVNVQELSSDLEEWQLSQCWYLWPIFDFAWLLYNFIFAPWIFWKNKRQWT